MGTCKNGTNPVQKFGLNRPIFGLGTNPVQNTSQLCAGIMPNVYRGKIGFLPLGQLGATMARMLSTPTPSTIIY